MLYNVLAGFPSQITCYFHQSKFFAIFYRAKKINRSLTLDRPVKAPKKVAGDLLWEGGATGVAFQK
jgi:hypothetical protein